MFIVYIVSQATRVVATRCPTRAREPFCRQSNDIRHGAATSRILVVRAPFQTTAVTTTDRADLLTDRPTTAENVCKFLISQIRVTLCGARSRFMCVRVCVLCEPTSNANDECGVYVCVGNYSIYTYAQTTRRWANHEQIHKHTHTNTTYEVSV